MSCKKYHLEPPSSMLNRAIGECSTVHISEEAKHLLSFRPNPPTSSPPTIPSAHGSHLRREFHRDPQSQPVFRPAPPPLLHVPTTVVEQKQPTLRIRPSQGSGPSKPYLFEGIVKWIPLPERHPPGQGASGPISKRCGISNQGFK